VELWTIRIPEAGAAPAQAQRAEAAGWDGIAYTDSQNLVGDPFVAIALGAAATEHLRFATGVTNVATRHPAALATVAATVQETSGGRVVLGVGRGDTALFHLGRPPMPTSTFFDHVGRLHAYLGGETVDCDGHPSRLRWLDRATQPRVPVDVAASGPKVISFAASTVERVTFAVGADPERLAWALDLARRAMAEQGRAPDEVSFGAYVNVGCHPDLEVARDMIRGTVAAFAHFSAMPGSTGAGLDERDRETVAAVGRAYDSNLHLVNTAPHTAALDSAFVDRFAVVGSPGACAQRLADLAALGLERFVVTGPSIGADPTEARRADHLLRDEVLPALRSIAGTSG
jgi:5,10-methylenetetrahydromethanopterin reductase